jgi:hypothetical protein
MSAGVTFISRAGQESNLSRFTWEENIMRNAALFTALFALAACNGADGDEAEASAETEVAEVAEVDPNTDAGFEAIAPGNYEVVSADGSIDQLTILPGMTWAMVTAEGEAAGGTIFAQDGKNCFVTEGVEGHQCFEGSEPAEDGSMEVTAEDGETMTVRPVESSEDTATTT